MNTKNSKTNESNRFKLCFINILNLKNNKTIAIANLSIYYTWKNIKSQYKNNKFKIHPQTWKEEFNLIMDLILYQIYRIILNMLLKNMKQSQMKILQ